MGTNRAALMRFLVKTFADSFEKKGLKALPHDWQQVMHDLDGRSEAQQNIIALKVAESPASRDLADAPRKSVTYSPKKTKRQKSRP